MHTDCSKSELVRTQHCIFLKNILTSPKIMKVKIFLLGLFCLNLFDGIHSIGPTEQLQQFKNDQVVILGKEFRRQGAEPAKWNGLSQHQQKGFDSNSNTQKVNSARRIGSLPSIATVDKNPRKFISSDNNVRNLNLANVEKKPRIFIASDNKGPNPRVRVLNSGQNNVDTFFKPRETKTYERTLSFAPVSISSNVQNRRNIGASSSSSRSAMGTTGITRPTFQRSSQNNPILSQTQLYNRRGSTGQILPSNSGTTGSRLNNHSGSSAVNRPTGQALSNSPGISRSNSMLLSSSSSSGFRRGRSNTFSNRK